MWLSYAWSSSVPSRSSSTVSMAGQSGRECGWRDIRGVSYGPPMDASPETLVDFHTHSHYSDGVLSPAALVERARTRRVGTLALTDHDTTAGLAEARAACAASRIRFVPGVELSAQWRGQTIHIVGLQVDESHAGLQFASRRGPAAAPGRA